MRLKWKLISVRLEIVLVLLQDRCTVCAKCTLASEIILDAWYSKVTRVKWKLVSVRLEILLILIQDWCTVCTERTVTSEIILNAPNGTPK
jgi:hypothetical protein